MNANEENIDVIPFDPRWDYFWKEIQISSKLTANLFNNVRVTCEILREQNRSFFILEGIIQGHDAVTEAVQKHLFPRKHTCKIEEPTDEFAHNCN